MRFEAIVNTAWYSFLSQHELPAACVPGLPFFERADHTVVMRLFPHVVLYQEDRFLLFQAKGEIVTSAPFRRMDSFRRFQRADNQPIAAIAASDVTSEATETLRTLYRLCDTLLEQCNTPENVSDQQWEQYRNQLRHVIELFGLQPIYDGALMQSSVLDAYGSDS